MHGLLIHVLKDYTENIGSARGQIAWMHYDRMLISVIENYGGFFFHNKALQSLGSSQVGWQGEKQSIYLYSDADIPAWLWTKGTPINSSTYPQYVCVSIFSAVKKAHTVEREDGAGFIKGVQKDIDQYLSELAKVRGQTNQSYQPVMRAWYNALGQEDLVLICASDSPSEMLIQLELMRQFVYDTGNPEDAFSPIEYSYSFIALNRDPGDHSAFPKALDANCLVSITFNAKAYSSEYLSILIKVCKDAGAQLNGTTGKYDMSIGIPKDNELFGKLFHPSNGLINLASHFGDKPVSDYVLQSKTTMQYDITNIIAGEGDFRELIRERRGLLHTVAVEAQDDVSPITIARIDEVIGNSSYLRNSASLSEAIWIMFSDYTKCQCSKFAQPWLADVTSQVQAFLELIEAYPANDSGFYESFEIAAASFRQAFAQIHQASRLFFDMPQVNMRYSGSYAKAMHAYYGIIKDLLYVYYHQCFGEGSKQSEIIPLIVFEHTPTVNTRSVMTSEAMGEKKRLVLFKLPYSAITNFPKYCTYLSHEVYHYICPPNRFERNWLYHKMVLDMFAYKTLSVYLNSVVREQLPSSPDNHQSGIILELSDKLYFALREGISGKMHASEMYDKPLRDFALWIIVEGEVQLFSNNAEAILETLQTPGLLRKINIHLQNEQPDNIPLADVARVISALEQTVTGGSALILETHRDLMATAMQLSDSLDMQSFIEKTQEGIHEAYADSMIVRMSNQEGFKDSNALVRYVGLMYVYFHQNNVNPNMLPEEIKLRIGIILHSIIMEMPWEETLALKSGEAILMGKIGPAAGLLESEIKKTSNFSIDKAIARRYEEAIREAYQYYVSNFGPYLDDIHALLMDDWRPLPSGGTPEGAPWHDKMKKLNGHASLYLTFPDSDAESMKADFRRNIKVLQEYQEQERIWQVNDTIKERRTTPIPPFITGMLSPKQEARRSIPQMKVETMAEFIRAISTGARTLGVTKEQAEHPTPIWYRGHTDEGYTLIPSLFRSYSGAKGFPDRVAPFDYQLGILDVFRARATTAPELHLQEIQSSFDWLINMQHYGAKTSLLDWTENAMISLYFALFPFKEMGVEAKVTPMKNAAVYLLSPTRMNEARHQMMHNLDKPADDYYPLLNLSNPLYSERYWAYSLDDTPKLTLTPRKKGWAPARSDDNPRHDWWPVATVVPTINSRVRAQYGTFTAFNLHCRAGSDRKDMNEFSIEAMHQAYKALYPNSPDFLFKIIITQGNIERLREELIHLGYNDMRVYPELERITSNLQNQVSKYFNGKGN